MPGHARRPIREASMRAQSTSPTSTGPASPLLAATLDRLRSHLEVDLREQSTALTGRRVAFASGASQAMPALERAEAAIQMYRTRRTIEDIEDALDRIVIGRYGICQACERSISLGRLDVFPQARFCAACP